MGVAAGVLIGFIAEYYTSYDYKPTRKIAQSSKEGAALTITQGLAVGMISCMAPLIVLGVALYSAYLFAGKYGVAMAVRGHALLRLRDGVRGHLRPHLRQRRRIAEMSELEPAVARDHGYAGFRRQHHRRQSARASRSAPPRWRHCR
jgi:K(+)-stimulated pyrophosphate-energized sodium pump